LLGIEPDDRAGRAPRAWPRFMTARVAADYCDSSPWTIRRHVKPCGRRGRSFVYALENVEEWMRGQSTTPRNDVPPWRPRKAIAGAQIRDLAKDSHRGGAVEVSKDNVAA